MEAIGFGLLAGWMFFVASQLASIATLLRELRDNLRHQINSATEKDNAS
jgi:hypothetical protein